MWALHVVPPQGANREWLETAVGCNWQYCSCCNFAESPCQSVQVDEVGRSEQMLKFFCQCLQGIIDNKGTMALSKVGNLRLDNHQHCKPLLLSLGDPLLRIAHSFTAHVYSFHTTAWGLRYFQMMSSQSQVVKLEPGHLRVIPFTLQSILWGTTCRHHWIHQPNVAFRKCGLKPLERTQRTKKSTQDIVYVFACLFHVCLHRAVQSNITV